MSESTLFRTPSSPNWLTVRERTHAYMHAHAQGASENYRLNLIISLHCSDNEFLWNVVLCVKGTAPLGGEWRNSVISCPESGV
jgi:hypothetical protein